MAAQRAHRRRVALTLVPVGATIQKRIRFKRTQRMRGSLRCGPASCPRALRSWRPATPRGYALSFIGPYRPLGHPRWSYRVDARLLRGNGPERKRDGPRATRHDT